MVNRRVARVLLTECKDCTMPVNYNVRDAVFTIAICTLNRRAYLEKAVDAALEQMAEFPRGSLLIIDNGSTDDTARFVAETAARQAGVAGLAEPRRGLYYARARAILSATSEFLIFLDDDAAPRAGWLSGMLRALLSSDDIGVVGCAIDPLWQGLRPQWLNDRLLREVPAFEASNGIRPAHFPCYPPGVSLGLRLNHCARLYASGCRLDDYPLGRKNTPAEGANFQLLGGDDTDLCEIYSRNGFQVVTDGRIRVWHMVQPERLSREWYLRRFESEGHLRIRLLRLTGRRSVSKASAAMLLSLPVFLLLAPLRSLLPESWSLLAQAYLGKSAGAWRELLRGPHPRPLPYKAPAIPSTTGPRAGASAA
jgi:glycosyltransferase involved in cell wall biosynthesis